MMSREMVQFPTVDAFHQGVALMGAAVPVYLLNEKRRVVAAGGISPRMRADLAKLGAILTLDGHCDSETYLPEA